MESGFSSLSRGYNCMKAKILQRRKRSPDSNSNYYAPPKECQPSFDNLKYGFRTRVALVENQSCVLDVTCTATGDRINVALSRQGKAAKNFSKAPNVNQFLRRRQSGDRINVARSRQGKAAKNFSKAPNANQFLRRQSGEEFQSDAPPSCRAVRDPTETCRNYFQVA